MSTTYGISETVDITNHDLKTHGGFIRKIPIDPPSQVAKEHRVCHQSKCQQEQDSLATLCESLQKPQASQTFNKRFDSQHSVSNLSITRPRETEAYLEQQSHCWAQRAMELARLATAL